MSVDSQTKADISNAVNAGLETIVPAQEMTVDSFTGSGYIIRDPQTGAGSYLISGGRDGGNSIAPDSLVPLPQLPTTGPVAFIIGAAALSAPTAIPEAALADTTAGVIGAIAAPEILAALAVIIVILLIVGLISIVLDTLYPPEEENVRHYTRESDPINGRDIQHIEKFGVIGILRSSADGFIYFANPEQSLPVAGVSQSQEGFSCPPTEAQASAVVAAYALVSYPNETPTHRVSAWVDLTFTRNGWPKREPVPNANGVTEIAVRASFLPYIKGFPIFGIQYDFTCR